MFLISRFHVLRVLYSMLSSKIRQRCPQATVATMCKLLQTAQTAVWWSRTKRKTQKESQYPSIHKPWYRTSTKYSPTVLCQRLTANRRLQVTVTTAGIARCGSVLAATWVTGELEGNFNTMMTSCCICSLNMSGLCGRKHWWRDRAWRRGGKGS